MPPNSVLRWEQWRPSVVRLFLVTRFVVPWHDDDGSDRSERGLVARRSGTERRIGVAECRPQRSVPTMAEVSLYRLVFWMLATAGVAVGHMAGYVIAHPTGNGRAAALGDGHGYLPVAATFVVPVAVVAALWWAVRTARELGIVGTLDWRRLAAAQIALFTLQEVGERLVGGEGLEAVITERALGIGLLMQVVVAFIVVRGLSVVRCVVRGIAQGLEVIDVLGDALTWVAPATSVATPWATVAVGLRAPPSSGSHR